uniref:Ig-like domain-containing protein n=1 Tax=Heliothis virescens TaxID=7102 RepID=A0A2A4K0A8_HELVI
MARAAAVCLFTAHFLGCIIVCRQDSGNNRPRDQSTVSESSRRFRTEFLEDWPQTPGAPYFDPSTPDNVTGLVGHPVILLCKVKNLQNRTNQLTTICNMNPKRALRSSTNAQLLIDNGTLAPTSSQPLTTTTHLTASL